MMLVRCLYLLAPRSQHVANTVVTPLLSCQRLQLRCNSRCDKKHGQDGRLPQCVPS
jgi:hypothetical protein